MNLTTTDLRVILDALEFQLAPFRKEQAGLDDTKQERNTELSNDIYYLEFLRDCMTDEYTKRIMQIQGNYQPAVHEHLIPQMVSQVAEHAETYGRSPQTTCR